MDNDYLGYYSQYEISPVKQVSSDSKVHISRRGKLYRQCGIPFRCFNNAEILEVEPGSGYNTLFFFEMGCKHVDLVEANEAGIVEMK